MDLAQKQAVMEELHTLLVCARRPVYVFGANGVVTNFAVEILRVCIKHNILLSSLGTDSQELAQLMMANYRYCALQELSRLKDGVDQPDTYHIRLEQILHDADLTYQDIGTTEREVRQIVAECHRLMAQKKLAQLQEQKKEKESTIPAIIEVCHHTAHSGVSLRVIEASAADNRQLVAV